MLSRFIWTESCVVFFAATLIVVTGSALALHCCKAHAKINGKIENSTPCKKCNPWRFQFETRHTWLCRGRHPPCNFRVESAQRGLPPNRENITLLWLFVVLYLFLGHAPRSNRCTYSYAEWHKRRVSAQGQSFWGSRRYMTSYREICPKNSPKRGVNRQFQAKTPKSMHRNISRTTNPTNKRFEDQVQTTKGTSLVVRHYPKANTTWLMAAILKIDMRWMFRFGEIQQPDAEWYADYEEMVEIETASRIPIWRMFVFRNRK